jgi:hypothetical protein
LAVAAIASVLAFPFGAALWLVPLILWFSGPRQLQLGPRYLLCGNAIVYYGNVTRLTLSRAQGSLRLQSANGQVFVLERDKFPTGARGRQNRQEQGGHSTRWPARSSRRCARPPAAPNSAVSDR